MAQRSRDRIGRPRAQQSALEHAALMWGPVREHLTDPRHGRRPHQRPDTCQHPTARHAMGQHPQDHFLLQIRGAVAEFERTLITKRMRQGRKMKPRGAWRCGSWGAGPGAWAWPFGGDAALRVVAAPPWPDHAPLPGQGVRSGPPVAAEGDHGVGLAGGPDAATGPRAARPVGCGLRGRLLGRDLRRETGPHGTTARRAAACRRPWADGAGPLAPPYPRVPGLHRKAYPDLAHCRAREAQGGRQLHPPAPTARLPAALIDRCRTLWPGWGDRGRQIPERRPRGGLLAPARPGQSSPSLSRPATCPAAAGPDQWCRDCSTGAGRTGLDSGRRKRPRWTWMAARRSKPLRPASSQMSKLLRRRSAALFSDQLVVQQRAGEL